MCGRRQHKGFTLVEMLVVIAVLLVLASITVVGLGRFSGPAKGKATLLSMENLRGLQAAYEAEVRQGLPYDEVREAPHFVTEPGVRELNNDRPDNIEWDGWGRYGNAVIETQRVLRRLLTVPANKQAYARLPVDQQMQVKWAFGVSYKKGDEVVVILSNGTRRLYRCTKEHVSSGSGPSASEWTDKNPDNSPVTSHQTIPLDGWGNPILFVPKGGLLMINRRAPDPHKDSPPPVVPPGPERPFWASAGDDGKFRNPYMKLGSVGEENKQILRGAEDNLYSFEN